MSHSPNDALSPLTTALRTREAATHPPPARAKKMGEQPLSMGRSLVALGVCLALAGCDSRASGPDAGGDTDAGSTLDGGGGGGDADVPMGDGGGGLDGGGVDAGGEILDGGGADAGPEADAGGAGDAGGADGGAGMDAGPVTDAGGGSDAGPVGGGAATSAQIQAVRDAADGATDLPIAAALVTYVKPAAGADDPPGLFVQAERLGPALFVQVDTAALAPPPAVGQVVGFNVDAVATTNGRREATAISGWAVSETGHDVDFLSQDVSGVDVETELDNLESELIDVRFTLEDGVFGFAGADHVQESVATAGLPGFAARFRLPQTLLDTLSYFADCDFALENTPMWRFNATPQLTSYDAAEITITCPAPTVTGAGASSDTEVVVSFSHAIEPGSVLADGSQFSITSGLAVSAAVAMGSTVALTTGPHAGGTTYTVTVAATVLDTLGSGVDPAANRADFDAFFVPTGLLINEVDYDMPGSGAMENLEFVEIYNPSASPVSLDGLEVILVNGATSAPYRRVPLVGDVPAMGYVVVSGVGTGLTVPAAALHFEDGPATNWLQNGAPDGVALLHVASGTLIDALSYEGAITNADIDGTIYDLTSGAGAAGFPMENDSGIDPRSLSRLPDGADTGVDDDDWALGAPTPGEANIPL